MTRLSDYIGNTPLIPIRRGEYTVWCKCEFMNPGGSVKDRMATYIFNNATKRGTISPGDILCEATSGNTGISFAMLAAERGYKMKIIMPSNMSEERKKIFDFYGADLIEVEAGDFDAAIALRDKLCKENGWFNCNQFHNELNIKAHYETTGPEIDKQFRSHNKYDFKWPQALVLGTGTGGTLMGTGKYLQNSFPGMKIIAVEPAESPVMSGGEAGLHGIQGIGDGSKFLVDMDFVDEVVTISTDSAKSMARELAKKRGLFVGISSGANVMASFQWMENNNCANVITVLCDRGERYFSCL